MVSFSKLFARIFKFLKVRLLSSSLSFLRKQESRDIDFKALDSRFHGNDTRRAWKQSSLKFLIWTKVLSFINNLISQIPLPITKSFLRPHP